MTEKPDFAGNQPRIDVTVTSENEVEELPTWSGWRSPGIAKMDEERRKRHNVSWRELLTVEMEINDDSWDYMEYIECDGDLDARFDNDYGGTNGCPFTAWTTEYVYFPIQYDGAEWVGSAPRFPCKKALKHQGGG